MKETTELKQKKTAIIWIPLISRHLMVLLAIIIISSYARDNNMIMLFLLFQILIQQWPLLIKIETIVKLTRKTKTVILRRWLIFQYIVVSIKNYYVLLYKLLSFSHINNSHYE